MTEPTIDAVLDRIRTEVRRRGLSLRKLGLHTDVHFNTLQKLHTDDWSPSVSVIRRLERYLFGSKEAEIKAENTSLNA